MAPRVEDFAPRLNIAIWTLTGVAALFLGLRLYCKVRRERPIRADDYVLVASWFALATSCSMLSYITTIGYGRHNADIAPGNFNYILLVSYMAGFFSILAACWSKISFAITLLYIVTGSRVKALLWFILVTVNLVLGASATIQFAQCWPPERLWHPGGPGHCWPRIVVIRFNIFVSAYSGCMDVVLALLPWVVVWTATISKKEKLSALFAMSMGVFAGITSFLKIKTLGAIGSPDLTDSVNLLIFGSAESAITIIAASIPILRGLLYVSKKQPRPQFFQEPATKLHAPSAARAQTAQSTDQGYDFQWLKLSHMDEDAEDKEKETKW
ncbi:28b4345e-900c-4955-962b-fcb257d3ae2b [Thermothielavioides terrestris]|uniref:28b4345e-900c-4955-962b-fcb257d3ae2b n=1 Tax=Thermothielavioides terrestris TaxID=2587410 RepID=A0A446BPV4_9PEZI|nr:28b4345e-900c-4955-962b-fcb257d3ae2b [Thermothielavioides terrestris]